MITRVIVWREEDWPYLWRFRIEHPGGLLEFAGMPNRCRSRRSAAIRGWWRARWINDGTFNDRYK